MLSVCVGDGDNSHVYGVRSVEGGSTYMPLVPCQSGSVICYGKVTGYWSCYVRYGFERSAVHVAHLPHAFSTAWAAVLSGVPQGSVLGPLSGADPGIHEGGGGHCGGRKAAAGEKNFFTSRLLYVSFTSFLVN